MKKIASLFLIGILGSSQAIAATTLLRAPQPTACITSSFTNQGTQHWQNMFLKLTNNCGQPMNFQNAIFTFTNSKPLNTNFWGDFNPLTYPDNPLLIATQPIGSGLYQANLSIHIPEEAWANSMLPNGSSITIKYGAPTADYDKNSVKVYLGGVVPVQTGEIDLSNTTPKPSSQFPNVTIIDITLNQQLVRKVELPWMGQVAVTQLDPGTYSIEPENVSDTSGNTYQGNAAPPQVVVAANQKIPSVITYTPVIQNGSIKVTAPALPSVLTGYTSTPSITFTRPDTGGTVVQVVPWNATTTVSTLANKITYAVSTPIIDFNNVRCTGSFNPASLMSDNITPPVTQLSYTCNSVAEDNVNINVSGLPISTTNINITLMPNDGSAPIIQNIPISGGSGTQTTRLVDGVIFNVSSTAIPAYTIAYNPQPLIAKNGATESITYTPQPVGNGRIITYIPGWKTPPSATSLANAGYTHVMIAFGVFSTSQPGVIVSAFDTVTKDYITSLHNAGIKAILSLGGAITSIPNTTVDFHQALALASSPSQFQTTFIQSVNSLASQFGFDGIDIDIEHGINPSGSFAQPTGDIQVLANILNTLRANKPDFLITLTPQIANVAATSGFDSTWGNYASLIMQTYKSLNWVEIQLYNAGCAFGIDKKCWDINLNQTPDASVAFATDLLEDWPTGFQQYKSFLTPDQVVIGYPAPDNQGRSDGSPVTPTSVIKRAIQCLRTKTAGSTSCDTYIPPRAYPTISGVFNWEATYDQANNFKFATDLRACVKSGTC